MTRLWSEKLPAELGVRGAGSKLSGQGCAVQFFLNIGFRV